jgi:hypothetical protein
MAFLPSILPARWARDCEVTSTSASRMEDIGRLTPSLSDGALLSPPSTKVREPSFQGALL